MKPLYRAVFLAMDGRSDSDIPALSGTPQYHIFGFTKSIMTKNM
jgi:hypothetical protein